MRYYSKPLMKQNIKTNIILAIVVLLIMCMMTIVINFATSVMGTNKSKNLNKESQQEFYSYLFVMANYNATANGHLSYEDFVSSDDKSEYEAVFKQLGQQTNQELSIKDFEGHITELQKSEIPVETFVSQFEYIYTLQQEKGCFDGQDLTVEGMMNATLEVMGVSPELVSNMGNMDLTMLLNRMYFTVIGLLPIFLFVVIVANALVANQVDSGSMAYILSTPTRRSAIVVTHALFLVVSPLILLTVVCLSKIASTYAFYDTVNVMQIVMHYVGMYLLVEAVTGVCYMGSCVFNNSSKAMAFGGGITVWFFLASLLGMFGSSDVVNLGMGVEELSIFNKLTLVGLYDINALGTIGTESVDYTFVWKFVVLAVIAVVCYILGSIRFQKKDLPL